MGVDLVLDNEKLVYSIINGYNGYYDKDDLYQVGMMGLINASKNYKEELGVKFSTYAYTYILGEVNKFIRENNNVRVSKDVIRLKKSIEKTKDIMRQKLLREPTVTELSLFLEIDEEKILEIESIYQDTASLDSVDYNNVKMYDKNLNAEILDLKDELDRLPDDEKNLIYKRYFMGMTQTELSHELGISQVQVYRKEDKIFQKLKSNL